MLAIRRSASDPGTAGLVATGAAGSLDSLTQAALGAAITGVCAPPRDRRKALLFGAALGTLPDLDVLIDYGDAVSNFTYHRGFSHSLFVLAPFSVLLWLVLRPWWSPIRESPGRWLAAIGLTLLTHPLLDAHTAYGTQLLWPLTLPPVSWSTLFIIDPLYSLPLLAGVAVAAFRPRPPVGTRVLTLALTLSTLYLGWSWVAKHVVESHARAALAQMELEDRPVFTTPTYFNTLLWRVVVLTDDGYLEGLDSLLVDEETMDFRAYPSDLAALQEASGVWAVRRLRWFARDFQRARVEDDRLLVTDLRMGQEPHYAFTHVVAERDGERWKAIRTVLVPQRFPDSVLTDTWQRILGE